ncbi:CoA ester lyase [Amycolatopsis sp. K13G38]|uniref:CoA ester lyase n=1 Tax=Amycolatopsis acididurans TaxID=2724524 RepID=A0ABX1JAT6_9PSEU|nr:aldolase/citrate lyase family protein [Amycolatopsis acididurans]NKQ56871.1 CoA ester lyase [Amycolatopsis acididurans]
MIARSWLFCPGERTDRLAKAVGVADVAVADLEDAVHAERKDAARTAVTEALRADPAAARRTWVRINNDGVHTRADLDALAGLEFAGIVVPKASAESMREVAARSSVPLLALVETAAGLWDAAKIAAGERVVTVTLGEYDLAVELGVARPDVDDEPLAWARSRVVAAAAAAGCAPPPAPVSSVIEDTGRYRADTGRLGRFGFFGRMCIHPRQVEVVHEVLRPGDEEVAAASSVVRAAEDAERTGATVLIVDGRLVDPPVVHHAHRILALAERG